MTMSTAASSSTSAAAASGGAADPATKNSSSHISSRPPSYGAIVLTLENVLIPDEKVNPSPTMRDGLDEETEMFLRIGGCELIQTSGILLKLPQTAMATGQVLFHRFFYSKSFIRQQMETNAMACIYLASKIEEAPRRIRDVINVFHHIRQYRARRVIQPLILDPSYIRIKSDVTLAERRILKELGFCVHVKHPHKIIVMYMKTLDYDQDAKFVQLAWNYMNDALRTNVFVRFTPEAIACACIFLSARILKIPLPNAPSWYLAFDVTDKEVIEISSKIMELYERPAINYEELEIKVDLLAKAHQEMKERGKIIVMQRQAAAAALLTPDNTRSPISRPPSPEPIDASSAIAILGLALPSNPHAHNISGTKPPPLKPSSKYAENTEKSRQQEYSNGDSDYNKRVQNDRERESPRSKKRRTPSPIVYNTSNNYREDDSPSRHKHKKRKKTRQSSSRSRSRSRSPRDRDRDRNRDRDRRSSKKVYRREKSPSPAARKHHKKKTHQRTRYSSSRSRSRSRDRRPTSKKAHYRARTPSPQPYSPPRKSHVKSLKKKHNNWP